MKSFFNGVIKFLKSRLFRNLIFWVLYIYNFTETAGAEPLPYSIHTIWFLQSFNFIFLAIVAYTNNFILVPRFLAKGKFVVHWSLVIVNTFLWSYLLVGTMAIILPHYPKIPGWALSPLSLKVYSGKWSAAIIMKSSLYYFISLMLVWVPSFTMAWYVNDHSKQKKISQEAQRKQAETELTFLKSQLNPHFLFNNLNNLYALALKNSEKTPDIILKLSAILRYLLYESNTSEVSFAREKEIMQAYIDLELLRLSETGNMQFTIQADDAYNIPPLLWLPVLENIFKHGTRIIMDNHFVDYRFIIEKGILTIYSKNNNKVTNAIRQEPKSGGIGIENLQKRLMILYKDRHNIDIAANSEYYTTNVQIKL